MDLNDPATCRRAITDLLASQPLGVLATGGAAGPYASLLAITPAAEDLSRILFATTRATRKFGNLQADPRVAVLVDSRTNRPADFREAIAVTILGTAREVVGEERELLARQHLERHPALNEFVRSPTCALCAVEVDRLLVVSHFQEVIDLRPGP
jgi:nitroimidazol reductase NimA-like FMN-containing flavoprotein (pyridoxamine 5'-phosphate oxidase superfamily)